MAHGLSAVREHYLDTVDEFFMFTYATNEGITNDKKNKK